MATLPCNICKLKGAGCNNCNDKSIQCSRFTPFWTDQKTMIVADAHTIVVPSAHTHIGNPMSRMDLEKVVRDYHVECVCQLLEECQ